MNISNLTEEEKRTMNISNLTEEEKLSLKISRVLTKEETDRTWSEHMARVTETKSRMAAIAEGKQGDDFIPGRIFHIHYEEDGITKTLTIESALGFDAKVVAQMLLGQSEVETSAALSNVQKQVPRWQMRFHGSPMWPDRPLHRQIRLLKEDGTVTPWKPLREVTPIKKCEPYVSSAPPLNEPLHDPLSGPLDDPFAIPSEPNLVSFSS